MKAHASAGRGRKDLRQNCERLVLASQDEHDASFLADLYRAIALGGRILIETWDGESRDECFLARPARRCPDCGSGDVYPRKNEGVCEAKCPDCGAIIGLDQTVPTEGAKP